MSSGERAMWWAYGGPFVNPRRFGQAVQLIRDAGRHAAALLDEAGRKGTEETASMLGALAGANVCLARSKMVLPLDLYTRLYGSTAVRERRFYNVGAGTGWWHPCWITFDINPTEPDCIRWDLMDRAALPLSDGEAALVYSSHTIEHVDDAAVEAFFAEVHRCLSSGGGFRVVCPDIDVYYAAYRDGFIEQFGPLIGSRPLRSTIGQHFLNEFASHASDLCSAQGKGKISDGELASLFAERPYEEALDACVARCSSDEQRNLQSSPHINWFNGAKLGTMLQRAGFSEVTRSAHGQSRFAVLRDPMFFDFTAPGVSLFFDAVK